MLTVLGVLFPLRFPASGAQHDPGTPSLTPPAPPPPLGAVLPILKTLFDTVLSSRYGRRVKDGRSDKKLPEVVRCTTVDGQVVVGIDCIPKDAELFMEGLHT